MVDSVRENLMEQERLAQKEKRWGAAFCASPENSRTCTLCPLVVTVTGAEGEPGSGGDEEEKRVGDKKKKGQSESSSE